MKQPEEDFAKHSKRALDNSLASLDKTLVKQLDAHRTSLSITIDSPKIFSKVHALALAASITAVSLITIFTLQNNTEQQTNNAMFFQHDDISYIDIDPEFLDTMEMLEVLGETHHAI